MTLDEGLKEVNIPLYDRPKAYKLMQDGITQRFEYSIDSFWKFLKFYLEIISKISIESPSPKVVFRQVLQSMLITEYEFRILIDCVTERNLTSHTYDEKTAKKIQDHIPLYYVTMKIILDRLQCDHN